MREGFILPCHRHSPDEGSLSGESTPCRWAKHCWILGRHTSIHGQSRKPTAISGCSRLVASEQVVFLASGNTKTAGSPEILPLSLTHQSLGKCRKNPNAANGEHDYICYKLWEKSQLGSGEGGLQLGNAPNSILLACRRVSVANSTDCKFPRTHHP